MLIGEGLLGFWLVVVVMGLGLVHVTHFDCLVVSNLIQVELSSVQLN